MNCNVNELFKGVEDDMGFIKAGFLKKKSYLTRRVSAFIIDLLYQFIFGAPILTFVVYLIELNGPMDAQVRVWGAYCGLFILGFLYDAYFVSKYAATPGQKELGLKVSFDSVERAPLLCFMRACLKLSLIHI